MEKREEETEDESIGKFIEHVPLDLIPYILSKLPVKSIVRFRSVSKLWSSITTRPDFIMRSRLCLLVNIKIRDKHFFISLPQQDTSYPHHVDRIYINAPPPPVRDYLHDHYSESVQGLICASKFGGEVIVWNPSMRQQVVLPIPVEDIESYFLGYDPVDDKYKVLCIPSRRSKYPYVFTLGPHESWRVITENCPEYFPSDWPVGHEGICINGQVYYEAFRIDHGNEFNLNQEDVLINFDVRHEKFNIITTPIDFTLRHFKFNYQGKLAWLCDHTHFSIEFWVLEDKEKQEWSPRSFVLPFLIHPLRWEAPAMDFEFEGVTHDTGEFIFVNARFTKIDVVFYDLKRNRTRKVIYEGFKREESSNTRYFEERDIHVYANHRESLMSLYNIPCYESD